MSHAPLTARRARPLALLLFVAVMAIGIGSTTTVASRPHVYRRTGIDVSHWQGRIDWDVVAASGVDFAIIKATEGSTKADEWYHRNRVRARRAGLYVAAYHFAHPGPPGSRQSFGAHPARRPERGTLLPAQREPQPERPHPGPGPGAVGRPAARRAARLDDDLPGDRAARHRGQADGLQHGLVLAQLPGRHHDGSRGPASVSCGSPTGTPGRRTCPVGSGSAAAGPSGSGPTAAACRVSTTASTATPTPARSRSRPCASAIARSSRAER